MGSEYTCYYLNAQRRLYASLSAKQVVLNHSVWYSYDAGTRRPDIYRKQQIFFDELRKIPDFHVVLCNMRKIKRPDGKMEFAVKGDDIYLATDMLSFAYENKYDVAVLVSGDGDFVPAIKKVQKLGKRVENAYFSANRSNFLKSVCNDSIFLDEVIKKCLKEGK